MSLPDEVAAVLPHTFLADLEPGVWNELLGNGVLVDITPEMRLPADPTPKIALVLAGLFRMTYHDTTGKMVTVRYIGPREFMGIPALVGGPVELSLSAFIPGRVWVSSGDAFRKKARASGDLAWRVAEEISRRLYASLSELVYVQCRPLRERLIFHLRALAEKVRAGTGDPAHRVRLPVRQQDLADGMATSREVVARALRDLRTAGLIETSADGIVVCDLRELGIDETPVRWE